MIGMWRRCVEHNQNPSVPTNSPWKKYETMLTEMSNMDNCFMPHLRFRVFGFHLFWNLMHKRMDTAE